MKKNIHKYFTLLSVSFLVFSCDKNALNTVPTDRLSTAIFWKTENDAKLAVNALYIDLDGQNILSWDALTDIAHTNQFLNLQFSVEQGTYDIYNTKVSQEWAAAYTGIRACSYFLENADRVATANKPLIERFKAEAKVLRAYQYIKLVGFYGDVPLITSSITLSEASSIVRTPVNEIWNFVDRELDNAGNVLPASYAGEDKGRITKGAAWALKARADIWAGRYQSAVDACNKVTGYTLYSSYQNLFGYAAENNTEIILDKQFIAGTYPNSVFNLLAPLSQKNSQSAFVPTKVLVDLYQTAAGKNINDPDSGYDPYKPYDNRDPRLRFSLFVNGDMLPGGGTNNASITFSPAPNSGGPDAVGVSFIASTTGFNIKKYVRNEDYANPSNCGINIILLRYAEVLLTYAEAKIELNQIDQSVVEAINKVRNERTDVKLPSITMGTQTAMREIVRRERTLELAFEGLHLFDIRRWRTAEAVMPGPVYGMTYVQDGRLVTVQATGINRTFDKLRHYLWPVPQTERNLNSNLTQNSNW